MSKARRGGESDRVSVNHKDLHSDSYSDLNSQREFRDLAAALSKSLQSLVQEEKPHQEDVKSKPGGNHRYESISYKKHLLKRHRGNVVQAPDNSKKSRDVKKNSKTGISGVRKPAEREYVFVKEHTTVSPGLHVNIGKKEEPYLRGKKSRANSQSTDITKHSDTITVTPDDVTKHSDTITVTPDDVTLPSIVTSPKSHFSNTNPFTAAVM